MTERTVTIDVRVQDRQELAKAAEARAVQEGTTAEDWRRMRANDGDPIGADLVMLLDPGSLAGCKIHGSEAQ